MSMVKARNVKLTEAQIKDHGIFDNTSVLNGRAKIELVNRVIHPDGHVVQLTLIRRNGQLDLNHETGILVDSPFIGAEKRVIISGQTTLSKAWWTPVDFELALDLIPRNWNKYRVHVIQRMLSGVICEQDYWRGIYKNTDMNPYIDYHSQS